MTETPSDDGKRFEDATLGTRIALWKWGGAIKTYPHGGPFPLTFHFGRPSGLDD